MQLPLQVVLGFVVIPFHGGLFERTVHPFHVALGPGLVGGGHPLGHPTFMTDASKAWLQGIASALPLGELEAVLGEHRVDLLGYGSDQVP